MTSSRYSLHDTIALLKHADMSSSYKPALLLAIARCVRAGNVVDGRILLVDLATQYLAMYWTQVVVFRLRHSPRDAAQPAIVQLIRSAAEASGVRKVSDLTSAVRMDTIHAIEKILPVNVLDAFHRSRPSGMPVLYTWQKKQKYLELANGAQTFIAENASALVVIATYFWARYLSGLNASPHIVEKLDPELPARSSLAKYARMLAAIGESNCFYCGKSFAQDNISATIDHFIPWTFVHEDKAWNFVLSCAQCNTAKSDGLPDEKHLERLVAMNRVRASSPQGKAASYLVSDAARTDLTSLYRLARDDGWPSWRRVPGRTR